MGKGGGEGGEEGGLINNLEHDSNYIVILHLQRTV